MELENRDGHPIDVGRNIAPSPQASELQASDPQASELQASELHALRERLAQFELVKCCMRHEQIEREADGLTPLLNAAVDHGFQRATYCDSKVRSNRLACAHTMARNELADLLETIPETVCRRDQVARWQGRVSELDLAIIQVDQEKSDAELAHAKQSSRICAGGEQDSAASEELERINSTIQRLDKLHCTFVEGLAGLLEEILTCLAAHDTHS